jgi:hypothetical protein
MPYRNKRNGMQMFVCKDWDALPQISNEDCIAENDPDTCCDGENSGTCDDPFDNANCIGDGNPMDCCTDTAEGVCDCWNDIKSLLIPVKNFLNTELDKWENITRQ